MTLNFLVFDVIVPKIFYFDSSEIYIPILQEFINHQKWIFKIDYIKRILFRNRSDYTDFSLAQENYKKELLMDFKLNSFDIDNNKKF